MQRIAFFVYGVVCHLLFLVVYAWLGAFVGNLPGIKTIDSNPGGSMSAAIIIDLLLILLFAAQHSIMARPAFKQVWTRIIPKPIERSTYVLASCIVTAILIWQWRAVDIVVWDAPAGTARIAL